MHLKWIVPAALLLALPLFADTAADPQQPPQVPETETGSDEIQPGTPTTPTAEEMNGRLDGLCEAFTEMRNSLENINRLRFSGYVQAQYVQRRALAQSQAPTPWSS